MNQWGGFSSSQKCPSKYKTLDYCSKHWSKHSKHCSSKCWKRLNKSWLPQCTLQQLATRQQLVTINLGSPFMHIALMIFTNTHSCLFGEANRGCIGRLCFDFVEAMVNHEGMSKDDTRQKFISCFGCHISCLDFHPLHFVLCMITYGFKLNLDSCMYGPIHCVSHMINLVVKETSHPPVTTKLRTCYTPCTHTLSEILSTISSLLSCLMWCTWRCQTLSIM